MKLRDEVFPGIPLVLGEGVSYCADHRLRWEERRDASWEVVEHDARAYRDHGSWGAVARTVPFLGVRAVAVHHEQQNDRRLLVLLQDLPDNSLQRFGGLSAVGVVHPVFHDDEIGATVEQVPLRPRAP